MLLAGFSSSGNAYGTRRIMAYRDSAYALREKLSGYEFYVKIKEVEENVEALCDTLAGKINSLRDKIFKRDRLVVSIAGEKDEESITQCF